MDKVRICGVYIKCGSSSRQMSYFEIYEKEMLPLQCTCGSIKAHSFSLKTPLLLSLKTDIFGWEKCLEDQWTCKDCIASCTYIIYCWITATTKRINALNILLEHVKEQGVVLVIARYAFPFRMREEEIQSFLRH